jgi:hypothetical protein
MPETAIPLAKPRLFSNQCARIAEKETIPIDVIPLATITP